MEIKAGATGRREHAASEQKHERFVCGGLGQDRGLLWQKIKGSRLEGAFVLDTKRASSPEITVITVM